MNTSFKPLLTFNSPINSLINIIKLFLNIISTVNED